MNLKIESKLNLSKILFSWVTLLSLLFVIAISSCKSKDSAISLKNELVKTTQVDSSDFLMTYPDTTIVQRYADGMPQFIVGNKKTKDSLHFEWHLYSNGKIKMLGAAMDSLRFGTWVAYNEKGVEISKATYFNGLENGMKTVSYPNGTIYYQGMMQVGKRVGIWIFYNPDGTFAKEMDFKEGIK